ncbi:dedicator of cytokinesis protein 3-like [Lithobates pipiens]
MENFAAGKRRRILDKYGDMRVMMTYELFNMWQNLGEHKYHFIPGMIGPFLGVSLVPQPEVRNIMIPIFHDMMDCEQRRNGNFKQVEAELIDKLDTLVSEGKGDENYRELFGLLSQLFGPYPSLLEKIEQETWREPGASFVTSVTRLMERLLDYRDCMKGEEAENKKVGCTVNLMNFYKSEINKEEMYIRYIHKLGDLHLQAESYTEAAFTLILYWEMLQWEERSLREFLHYPAQTEWQRKESLSRKIIHYFNKGKCWEYAIPLCRELAAQYEKLYDFQSLSWILKMEASYYDHIMDQQRLEPEFFRVGFYGKKFPFFLRNKEFVCRGHDYERLEAFQQRMLSEFPQAIAMQHLNHPDDTILQSDAQYLQIYAVTPLPDTPRVLSMDHVPERIKSFYRVNNVRRFRYDRPFHRGARDKDNEFKSLWIERSTLTLSHSLPGISCWFEVQKRELVEVSPLENAIQVLTNKTQELRALITQYQHHNLHGNINLLSMCLNGVIDAAVNGGITRYQEAFFDKEYIAQHPEDADKISQLKELMQEQVHVLGVGLAVHERCVHPEMRPLHKKLVDQFQVMRSSLYQLFLYAPQEFPTLEKMNPSCAPLPRGNILLSHGALNNDSLRLLHRHSPLVVLGSVRHSSSSLSSHTSSDTGTTPTAADSENEDPYSMQMLLPHSLHAGSITNVSALSSSYTSPSSSSLSSTHSAPSQLVNSAPSSTRGSPSLPDKYRHSRDLVMLLPAPRDRPSSAMYQTGAENAQRCVYPRALFQQVLGPCKPCSDPNLSVAEKVLAAPSSWSLDSGTRESLPFLTTHVGSVLTPTGTPRGLTQGHYSLHFDAFHPSMGDGAPALPTRSLMHLINPPLAGTELFPDAETTIEMLHSCSVVQVGAVSGPLKAPQNQACHNLEASESICGVGEIPLPTGLEGFPKVLDTFSLEETWSLEEAHSSINIMDSVIHSVLNLSTARSSNDVSVRKHHGSGLHQASRSLTAQGEANQIMVWVELHVPFLCAMHIPGMQSWKSPLHTIPASPTSPQSCLDGSNSPLSGSASSGVSSLSEGNFSSCPDAATSADSRTEEEQSGCFQHYPPVRYSLSDPNGLETSKTQPCRSHSAPTGERSVCPDTFLLGEERSVGPDICVLGEERSVCSDICVLGEERSVCPDTSVLGEERSACPDTCVLGEERSVCPDICVLGEERRGQCVLIPVYQEERSVCPDICVLGEERSVCPDTCVLGEERRGQCVLIPVYQEERSVCPDICVLGEERSVCPDNSVLGEERSVCPDICVLGEERSVCPDICVLGGEERSVCPDICVLGGEERSVCPDICVLGEERSVCPDNSVLGEERSVCPDICVLGEERSVCPDICVLGGEERSVCPDICVLGGEERSVCPDICVLGGEERSACSEICVLGCPRYVAVNGDICCASSSSSPCLCSPSNHHHSL